MATIFALSSGTPPAGIGVIRISGPDAFRAVERLARRLPPPRTAALRGLRDSEGRLLDRALVLLFPGPASATGEDLAELHCHGGRAVIAAVLSALDAVEGLRRAVAGEFTRRALENGRIDLAEASGLADLLAADTERQRIAALSAAEGIVSQKVRGWLEQLTMLAALTEAQLDFADEDDVGDADIRPILEGKAALVEKLRRTLANPPVERLRDGVRVVLAGPPNSGKSTLINLLSQRDVAIVSDIAGTTRDRIEAAVTRDGLAYVLTDTAGLTDTVDPIERIGVERAEASWRGADIVLWLGDECPPRPDAIWVQARSDVAGRAHVPDADLRVAQTDSDSIARLWSAIAMQAERLVPRADALSLHERERDACREAMQLLAEAETDPLLIAEQLRLAMRHLATILGVDATKTMLDALFGRFCIGK